MNEFKGGCHCGGPHPFRGQRPGGLHPPPVFVFHVQEARRELHLRSGGGLMLRYRDETQLSLYRFGHRTAQWVICSECGVLVAVLCEIAGQLRAVVRVQSMEEYFPRPEVATNFESESVEERLQRRARTWIGTVTVSPPLVQGS